MPRLTLVPRPIQKPHPPVWVATRLGTQEAIDFAAARGFRLLCAWAPRAELRKTHDQLVEAQSKLDIREPFVFTCLRHVFVAETDAIAKRDGEKYIEYYMNSTALFRPVGPHERTEMIFGGPRTCIEKLEQLREEAGVNNLVCWMNFGGLPMEMVERSMRLFASEVMPALREEPASAAVAVG